MANKQEIFEILTMLAAVYPRYSLTKEAVAAYTVLLEDLDPEELRASAKDIATKNDFFPSIHELRSGVVRLRAKINKLPTAFEAWGELLQAGSGSRLELVEHESDQWGIQRVEFVFSHQLVEQTARLLGWPGKFPGDNLMADRAHFVKAYERAVNEAMDDQITLPEIKSYIELNQQKQLEVGNDGEKD